MRIIHRGLVAVWLLGLGVPLTLTVGADGLPANTTVPPTAVPVVGVRQVPLTDVFKSWADYRFELNMESDAPGGRDKFSGVHVVSMETRIRRVDTGQEVARIPFRGAIGGELTDERPGHIEFTTDTKTYPARNSSFPDDQAQALDKNPPGDYLLAVYVNSLRASNVVKIRRNPAFDAAKAPTLQLAGLEPGPRAQFGEVYFLIVGPKPVDPILQTRFLTFSLGVDGVTQRVDLGMGSGPRGHALASGERKVIFLTGQRWIDRDILDDSGHIHTYTVSISGTATRGLLGEMNTLSTKASHYEATPFTFDPKAHLLGDAWDAVSPPDEKRPATPPAAPPTGAETPALPVTSSAR